MGSSTQLSLGLGLREGTVIAPPTRQLQRGSCARILSKTCGISSGSTWRSTSTRCSHLTLCCESKPLLRKLSRRLCFDPLFKQTARLMCHGRRAVPDGEQIAPLSVHVTEEEAAESQLEIEEELSTVTLLWRAAKIPIYSVCIIPLTVGAAAAYWQTGVFYGARYWLMLWSSVLIITWLNLSNDAYDAETGVDKFKKESVVNITGSQKGVLWVAFACLAFGLAGLVTGASQAGDMRVAILLVLAVACGYVYQCPPFRLSYKGLGEPLCFLAFGPFATTAFYLSQAHPSATAVLPVKGAIMGASTLVGITTSLILFCSHFHQIEGDIAAGKISPLVRLGTEKGAKVVQVAVDALYSIVFWQSIVRAWPLSCSIFSLLTVSIGKWVVNFVQKNHTDKKTIFMAKYFAVRLHVALGLALSLGFILASKLPLPA